MTKFLHRLQKEVLDKFPFSISGYNSPDKEYEEFFHRICKFQESLDGDSKIHFTISGFAKLKAIENLSETEFDKWETESLKDFLFNDNYLGFPEPILSLYITLLERLSTGKRVVNILAKNVNNSIQIKVMLRDELEKIHFRFVKSDNTLLIEVPLAAYFKNVRNGRKVPPQDIFRNIDYESDLIVRRKGHTSSYLIDITEERREKFDSVLAELLSIDNIETITSHPPESIYDKLLKDVLKNDDYTAKEIYSLIFASAVLCLFYECSLTYFVSTAREANGKRYTLGAMGIGVRVGHELTDNDKALYSILVNHLAANLSTQLIYESNKYLKREANKLLLKSSLKSIRELQLRAEKRQEEEFLSILHGSSPVTPDFDRLMNQVIKENQLLTDDFLTYYNYLKSRNGNRISKYCLVTLIDFCKECNIKDRCHTILKVEKNDCCQASRQIELINLPLLESIVKKLKNEGDDVSCEFLGDEIVFTLEKGQRRSFNLIELRNKLSGIEEYGDFLNYLSKNFEAVDCHGVVSIYGKSSDGEYVELFHSRKTIQDMHNHKFVLNENYPFPTGENFSCIQLKFKNEL